MSFLHFAISLLLNNLFLFRGVGSYEKETITLEIKSLLTFVDELEIDDDDTWKHQYSTRTMLKLYLYMLIKRISGFKTIAKQPKLKPEFLSLLGLG